jgi:hypothetical protein
MLARPLAVLLLAAFPASTAAANDGALCKGEANPALNARA